MMGFLKISLGLREQASWMHTHLVSFVEISYTYSSSASVAWQSLLLMLTSIDGHLHSPLIILVNVRLSPFLSFFPFFLLFFSHCSESHPDLWGNHSLHHSFLTWDNALKMMIITLLLFLQLNNYNLILRTKYDSI